MTDDLMRQVALEIRRSGMTFHHLAHLSGVSVTTIWRIAHGMAASRSTTPTKIAAALGKQIAVNEDKLVDTANTVSANFASVRHAMRMARWQ